MYFLRLIIVGFLFGGFVEVHGMLRSEAELYCNERGIKVTLPKKKISDLYGEISAEMQKALNRLEFHSFTSSLLLYGPKGAGKTTFAEAIAAEYGRDFYSIKFSDCLSEYQGSGAALFKALFATIRERGRPAVIFCDELRGTKPGTNGNNVDWHNAASSLWQEIQECNNDRKKLIYCIGAINEIKDIDLTLKDRFNGNLCRVDLPSEESRKKLIAQLLDEVFDTKNAAETYKSVIATLANETGLSFRDWQNVIGEAETSVKKYGLTLTDAHLMAAFAAVKEKLAESKESFFIKYKQWLADHTVGPAVSELTRGAVYAAVGYIAARQTSGTMSDAAMERITDHVYEKMIQKVGANISVPDALQAGAEELQQSVTEALKEGVAENAIGSVLTRAALGGLAVAFVSELYDYLRERYWPTVSQQEAKNRYDKARMELEEINTIGLRKHKERLARIAKEQKMHEQTLLRLRVKREFYKSLAMHKDDQCDETGLPLSCKDIAQKFRELFGEQAYNDELKAHNWLKNKNRKIAIDEVACKPSRIG